MFFMNNIESIIRNVTSAMKEVLNEEQLQKLQNVLCIQFHGLKLEEENTQLITSESGWQKILKLYTASKRLENCAESTVKQYSDCVIKMVTSLKRNYAISPQMIFDFILQCSKRAESVQYLIWTRYAGIYQAFLLGRVTRDLYQEIQCAGSGI